MTSNHQSQKRSKVVIIGAGFGGLQVAKRLRNKPFDVLLIDRNNYHTFQPLLYQVATGGLEPDSIAYPIRKVFRNAHNVHFRMGEVMEVHPEERFLTTSFGDVDYDYLVIATGSKTNFFSFASVEEELMPLKSVPDALNLRSFIFQNLERAITLNKEDDLETLINVAIVGGGPTGVELAGALGEMKKYILPKDYPGLDVQRMRIVLYEAAPRLLPAMSEQASRKAMEYLDHFDAEVLLNTKVAHYDGHVLTTEDGRAFPTSTVIWSAGVQGARIEGMSEVAQAGSGRLTVNVFNMVKGYDNIFAIGDIAAMITDDMPKGHPQLAPIAIQQGQLLASNLVRLVQGRPMKPFHYFDKGVMATVGRNRAVVDMPFFRFQGFFAWWVWMFVHLMYLVGFRNKWATVWDWAYNYLTYDRAMRLIIRPYSKKRNDTHAPVREPAHV